MIAVSMGKFGTKELDRTAVPTQKDPIVIDGNQENPENPAALSSLRKLHKACSEICLLRKFNPQNGDI